MHVPVARDPVQCQRGMTLIELLLTLAVVAILTTLAFSGYGVFILEARRSDAVLSLLEMAAEAENDYLQERVYKAIGERPSRDGHYLLSLAVEQDGQGFRASATALLEGSQADDACGGFWLDSRGRRGVSSVTEAVETCWKQ